MGRIDILQDNGLGEWLAKNHAVPKSYQSQRGPFGATSGWEIDGESLVIFHKPLGTVDQRDCTTKIFGSVRILNKIEEDLGLPVTSKSF